MRATIRTTSTKQNPCKSVGWLLVVTSGYVGPTMVRSIVVPMQAVQENEDDNVDVGSDAEISDLLGEKEHLYPKILYLVIADSAYVEGKWY